MSNPVGMAVAVKEMKGDRQASMHEVLKESRVMASIIHENICKFVGISSRAGRHYIISELMDCSLFDLVHQPYKINWSGDLNVSLCLNLTVGICKGIVYLHSKSLVHADLKSSNILIDFTSALTLIPKICDFGHAAVRAHPAPHHRCGTPHWAAPEALRNDALSPAADVFSIGIMLWEMITQRTPHVGLTFGQVVAVVGWAGWLPEMDMLPEVTPEVREIIQDCLSFRPESRPSAKEVQRRVRRIPLRARLNSVTMLHGFLRGRKRSE